MRAFEPDDRDTHAARRQRGQAILQLIGDAEE